MAAEGNPALDILIVGSGIGGLTAALGFRQQGHNVTLFERSRLLIETGAALVVAPNCQVLLRRFGFNPDSHGATVIKGAQIYGEQGQVEVTIPMVPPNGGEWEYVCDLFSDIFHSPGAALTPQKPPQSMHRQDLHAGLRHLVTDPEGKGKPAKLYTASRVVSVDTKNATIELEDGQVTKGDLVIGADGLHSVARKFVPGGNKMPLSTGKSAYRFLIPREDLANDPRTASIPSIAKSDHMAMFGTSTHWLIMYPCRNGTLMNFAAFQSSDEVPETTDGEWNQEGRKDNLLRLHNPTGPHMRAILEHVDPKTLKVWPMQDMENLPTWTHERLALLGDAAHPFLPYQGQGGAQAIEDAAALVAVLPAGTPRSEIADRLKLYEQCRYERAGKIMDVTRVSGKQAFEVGPGRIRGGEASKNFEYQFMHDEWLHTKKALEDWQGKRASAVPA